MILHRIEGSKFSTVSPDWSDAAVVIIGGGPSLTREQVECVRAKHGSTVRVIAVNDAYLWTDFADVLFAGDLRWWEWAEAGTDKPKMGLNAAQTSRLYQTFSGERCTVQQTDWKAADPRIHYLRNRDFPIHGVGISRDPGAIVTGRNSGSQALNLAVLAGARKIILLGIDGEPARDGATHFHGGHAVPPNPQIWQYIRRAFALAENILSDAGVRVFNCSPTSAIGFEKMPIEKALDTCANMS